MPAWDAACKQHFQGPASGASPARLMSLVRALTRFLSAVSSSVSSDACAAALSKPALAAARALSVCESFPCTCDHSRSSSVHSQGRLSQPPTHKTHSVTSRAYTQQIGCLGNTGCAEAPEADIRRGSARTLWPLTRLPPQSGGAQ